MPKTSQWLIAALATSSLFASPLATRAQSSDVNSTSSAQSSETDQATSPQEGQVVIQADWDFKSMSAEAKQPIYQALDQIQLDPVSHQEIAAFEAVKPFEGEEDYMKWMLSTSDQPSVVYLGYDESAYCQAFTPKLAALAKSYGVTVHYYNVRMHAVEESFPAAMRVYGVETVPHAFIVKDGKPVTSINHQSSMAEIEDFVKQAAEAQ